MTEVRSKSKRTLEDEQLDLFVANLVDIPIKGEMTTMEYPVFSLSTRKDTEIFRYENPNNGAWLEVIPSAVGRATIFDKDILIYCISQIREAMNRGKPSSRRLHIIPHDCLKSVGRGTGGKDYKAMQDALTRLRGTTFRSSVFSDDKRQEAGRVFGLLDDAKTLTKDGKMVGMEVVIGEALYEAIETKKVLTYNPDYFSLRSANDRRMYELCRKHCGNQATWQINLDNLHAKFGSRASLREFRRMIKKIVDTQPLPDYVIDYEPAVKSLGVSEKIIVCKDKDGTLRPDYLQ